MRWIWQWWNRSANRGTRDAGELSATEADPVAFDPDEAVALPIDGALDLHHFRPRDLRTLVPDYLRECQAKGILEVRVIHGKGKGQLRRSVHALLERDPMVAAFGLCPPERGGWGATLVQLHPPSPPPAGSATED